MKSASQCALSAPEGNPHSLGNGRQKVRKVLATVCSN